MTSCLEVPTYTHLGILVYTNLDYFYTSFYNLLDSY